MVSREQLITNPTGLHARPAGQLVNLVKRFKCEIKIKKGSVIANPKSILSVLAGEFSCGSSISITTDGEDEEEAMEAICQFLSELKE